MVPQREAGQPRCTANWKGLVTPEPSPGPASQSGPPSQRKHLIQETKEVVSWRGVAVREVTVSLKFCLCQGQSWA